MYVNRAVLVSYVSLTIDGKQEATIFRGKLDTNAVMVPKNLVFTNSPADSIRSCTPCHCHGPPSVNTRELSADDYSINVAWFPLLDSCVAIFNQTVDVAGSSS